MGDYNLRRYIEFAAGDFVVDIETSEVGLLIKRFNVIGADSKPDEYPAIYAWDIIWSGSRYIMNGTPRRAPYTENSLKNMVIEGLLVHYKNN